MNRKYILGKDGQYAYITSTNRVTKTILMEEATVFTKEKAQKMLERANRKLKGFTIEHIFQVAAVNGTEILVLGAFGCGAFCNPPMIVARAFRNVQEKYAGYFDTIEYAVFCKKNETENYDAFCREFPKTKLKS